MNDPITIDGSNGEGGGQMLRTSLSLSAAYGKPFEMQNIRAKRDKPGLKRQHLTCVRAVAQICGAQVEGDEVGSMRLSFKPGKIKGGTVEGVVSHIPRSIAEAEVGIVGNPLRDLMLERVVREVDALGPGNYCCARLRYERATVVISAIDTYGKSRKSVANEVAHQIRDFVKSGKACEKHLADQLLVPLHLFLGQQKEWDEYYDGWVTNWSLAIQKETSHYTTNEQVISAF